MRLFAKNQLKPSEIAIEVVDSPGCNKYSSRFIGAVRGCNRKSNKKFYLFFQTIPMSGDSIVQFVLRLITHSS